METTTALMFGDWMGGRIGERVSGWLGLVLTCDALLLVRGACSSLFSTSFSFHHLI